MLTSFSVGAVFEVDDRASGSLANMAEGFARLDELARSVQESLTALGQEAFGGLSAGIDRIATAMTSLQDSARTLGENMTGSLDAVVAATTRSAEGVDGITAAFDRAAAAAGRYRDAMGGGGVAGVQPPMAPLEDEPLPLGGSRGRRRRQDVEDDDDDLAGWNAQARAAYPNARAENSNIDAVNQSTRRAAEYENNDRDRAADQVRREAEGENLDFDRRRDEQRRQAEYENDQYDRAERQRVHEARPDESFFEREMESGGAGYLGGRAGRRGHGAVGGVLHGMAPLIEAGGVYEAEKSAAEEDLAIRNALIEGLHITPEQDPQRFQRSMEQMRQIASEAARGTIYSESQSAVAMPVLARELGFTGQEGMEKFGQIYRPALQAAEVAQQTGLGSLDSSLSAGVEYAHMTGSYDPAQLEQHLNVLRSVAQLTNQTMHGEESILKYSVPIGIAAGMDPDEAAVQTGFLQQRGFNSSTAGTGLSALILGALNTGGGIGGHLETTRRQMEHQFASALHLTPGEATAQHGGRGSEHVRALADLGITHGGQLTTVDAQGNFDIGKLQEDIAAYAAHHSRQETLKALHDAFGTRGERVAASYIEPQSIQQLQRFNEAVRTSPTARQIQGDLAQSPMQQFEQMLSNFSNIGNTLATTTLPGLNSALQTVNSGLVAFNDFLKQHETAATVAGYGAGAAGAAGAVGALAWAGRGLWGGVRSVGTGIGGLFGAGGGEALSMGAEAAGGGGLLSAMPGMVALLALSSGAHTALQSGSDYVQDSIFGKGDAERTRRILAGGPAAAPAPAVSPAPPHVMSPADAAPAAAGRTPAPAASAPPNITVNVGGVTMSGVADESTFTHLLTKLTDALRSALSHASGGGQGSDNSIYVTGGP